MAHLNDHCRDCERILGMPCVEVNRWLDEMFRHCGPRHRAERHHWEGVHKARELFGPGADKAAVIHIVRDCGHVPNAADYEDGAVDFLGIGEFAPEQFQYDGLEQKAWDRFTKVVMAELQLLQRGEK